jgi:hypothetical protein
MCFLRMQRQRLCIILQITTKDRRQSNSDMSVLMGHFNTTDNNNIKGNTSIFDEDINSNNEEISNEILHYTIIQE